MNPLWNPYHTDVLPSGLLTEFNFTLFYRLNQSCLFEKNSKKTPSKPREPPFFYFLAEQISKLSTWPGPSTGASHQQKLRANWTCILPSFFSKEKHVTSHPGYHKHLLEKPTRSTVNSFFVGRLILPNSQLGGLLNPRYLKTCHSYIYIYILLEHLGSFQPKESRQFRHGTIV